MASVTLYEKSTDHVPITSQSLLDLNDKPDPRFIRDSIISDFTIDVINLVVLVIFCGVISGAGLVANVINVVVFFRQGVLSSSSNVSLLTLAFADIGVLSATLSTSISYFLVEPGGLFLTPQDFMEISTMWTRIMFVQTAGYITAYIAIERCVCVVFPFKAKTLFSATRTLIVLIIISGLCVISFVPIFATQTLIQVQDETRNTTKLASFYTALHNEIITVSDFAHAVVLRTLVVLVVFTCTQITACRIRRSQTWRQAIGKASSSQDSSSKKPNANTSDVNPTMPRTSNPSGNNLNATARVYTIDARNVTEIQDTVATYHHDPPHRVNPAVPSGIEISKEPGQTQFQKQHQTSPKDPASSSSSSSSLQREHRLVRMITAISSIYLVCNLPDIVGVYLLYTVPSLQDLSPVDNVFQVMIASQFLLESINSSINLLVYYNMSSRYRQEFRLWFRLDRKKALG